MAQALEIEKPGITGMARDMGLVLTRPGDFFEAVGKSRGMIRPLLFLALMGFLSALIQYVTGRLGLFYPFELKDVFISPIVVAVFGLILSLILFGLWRAMGSARGYEEAFRCLAYAWAVFPVGWIVVLVPYAGYIALVAWATHLYVTASVRVHGLSRRRSWAVFGAIGLLFLLVAMWGEWEVRHQAQSPADTPPAVEAPAERTPGA